jgi:DNA primase
MTRRTMIIKHREKKIEVYSENNDEIWCFCPFHDDTGRPNLLVSKTGGYAGFYKCFGCGKFGDAKNLGFDIRSNKYQKAHKQPTPINWTSLSQTYESCTINEYRYHTLMEEWNVSRGVLEALNLGWDGEAYTFPMRNEYFEISGIQRRFMNGKKRSIKGSQLGCIIPTTIDFSDVILVCEGTHDTATVMDLGFEAIGRPGACTCYEIAASVLTGCRALIIPDKDEAGIRGARALAHEVTKGSVCGIINTRSWGCKDISGLINIRGKDRVKEDLKQVIRKMKCKG